MSTDRVSSDRVSSGPVSDDRVSRVDFGYRTHTVRLRGVVAQRLSVRESVVSGALVLYAVALGIVSMGIGDFPLSVGQVVGAFLGQGADFDRLIVLEWRAPVVVAALVFGAVLAVGGAIFQSLTRNPLGSPDVIGFDAGSYTAVVVAMLVLGTRNFTAIATAALIGGMVTALVVYVLAYRRGIQGFRLIVVGIGVAAMLGSLNSYLVTRADLNDAMAVGFWGAGSIAKVTWTSMVPSLFVALVVLLAAIALSPALRQLELGDDAALALGTDARRSRLGLMVVGVATTALVTAAAGPIGFIALAAPQLARRVARTQGTSIVSSAAMGAALLASAHLLSLLIAVWYRPVPVGLLTVCVGGLYLIWLLVGETRRHAAGR